MCNTLWHGFKFVIQPGNYEANGETRDTYTISTTFIQSQPEHQLPPAHHCPMFALHVGDPSWPGSAFNPLDPRFPALKSEAMVIFSATSQRVNCMIFVVGVYLCCTMAEAFLNLCPANVTRIILTGNTCTLHKLPQGDTLPLRA